MDPRFSKTQTIETVTRPFEILDFELLSRLKADVRIFFPVCIVALPNVQLRDDFAGNEVRHQSKSNSQPVLCPVCASWPLCAAGGLDHRRADRDRRPGQNHQLRLPASG